MTPKSILFCSIQLTERVLKATSFGKYNCIATEDHLNVWWWEGAGQGVGVGSGVDKENANSMKLRADSLSGT